MNRKYNLVTLEALISDIKQRGYDFVEDPTELLEGSLKIFLRHDVDVSLSRAFKVLQIEKKLDVRGVFFLMVNSPFYNLSSESSENIIKTFTLEEASIGLHANIQTLKNLKEKLYLQKTILELYIKREIKVVSFHHPTPEIMSTDLEFMNMQNMYRFCDARGIRYFSDSNMNLNLESVLKSVHLGENFQLLIHPVWWTDSLDYPSDLWPRLVDEKCQELTKIISQTERSYNKMNTLDE